MDTNNERYNRVLETLYKLASDESAYQGERDAAKELIAIIESKLNEPEIDLDEINKQLELREQKRRESDREARKERERQAELNWQRLFARFKAEAEEYRKTYPEECNKSRKCTKQRRENNFSRTEKLDMRANWVNNLIKESGIVS